MALWVACSAALTSAIHQEHKAQQLDKTDEDAMIMASYLLLLQEGIAIVAVNKHVAQPGQCL